MIVGIWGNDKTGKTSLALTFPKPLHFMELDLGGFDRAKVRFKEELDSGLVTHKEYVVPVQGELSSTLTFKPSKVITGMKEFWYQFLQDYLNFLGANNGIATGVIDTGTLLWESICTAFLQEKQEGQLDKAGNPVGGKEIRTSLMPIEYREPNIRMRGLIYQARVHKKNLILTHHSRDVYASRPNPKTGTYEEVRTNEKERAGFNSLGDSTDLMLRTYMDNRKFMCKVCDESIPPSLVGAIIEEPTFGKISTLIDNLNGY